MSTICAYCGVFPGLGATCTQCGAPVNRAPRYEYRSAASAPLSRSSGAVNRRPAGEERLEPFADPIIQAAYRHPHAMLTHLVTDRPELSYQAYLSTLLGALLNPLSPFERYAAMSTAQRGPEMPK